MVCLAGSVQDVAILQTVSAMLSYHHDFELIPVKKADVGCVYLARIGNCVPMIPSQIRSETMRRKPEYTTALRPTL
jgi:hypothetical protein